MEPKKRVLVVDDLLVDRLILEKILKDDYTVVQAADGKQALDILEQSLLPFESAGGASSQNKKEAPIAGIILDLRMPVMDGYAVLEELSSNEKYKNIPVVVSTGDGENEIRALELGAWDFVAKPYDPSILKFRLRNVIERSQLSAFEKLQYVTDYDTLTGIYRKTKLYEATRAMLNANPDENFAVIRFDIDRFQLINSFFGHDEGDQLLRFIADSLRRNTDAIPHRTFGRIDADVFAVCMSYSNSDQVYSFINTVGEHIRSFKDNFDVLAVFGIYFVNNNDTPINTMLDRATLAAKSCKGSFTKPFAEYTESMSKSLSDEQEVLNEVHQALINHEFIVYFQPKYDLASKLPIGAEALARWRHPEKGIVSPAGFIPICEKNGLVSRVDHCIWEAVCGQLRDWIDAGIKPLPISVNMSLVNLYNPNIVKEVCDIAAEYGINHDLLQIEMTESAYMDNPEIMKRVVNGFHDAGFQVHMDDFGSGYSSLSILKDIDVDLLKIDMRFLSASSKPGRGESILAAVVRMAKWLGIPTITEGVEELHQIDFLKSVGCDYAQGFYLSRPIPAEEYEIILRCNEPAPDSIDETCAVSALWNVSSALETHFAKGNAPLCIVESQEAMIDVVRANQSFCELVGADESFFAGRFLDYFTEESGASITDAIKSAVENDAPETCLAETKSGKKTALTFAKIGAVGSTWVMSCAAAADNDQNSLTEVIR